MYLFIIIEALLVFMFVDAALVVRGDVAATVNNILANERLFRVGLVSDLIMFASVVILALALFAILKSVNKNLALLALLWRVVEATLGCVAVLVGIMALLLLTGEDYATTFTIEQRQALIGLFLDVRTAVYSLVLFFVSLGSLLYFYLFFKSGFIPRILAAVGIVSFLLMLVWPLVNMLSPDLGATIQIVCYLPAVLFELFIGFWLLVKGITVQR
ncbi:MAG: DUF4386 family protein [Anaerolineae bacterium]|nr:DUF4386 family protein [Anaerolineae bacterium]